MESVPALGTFAGVRSTDGAPCLVLPLDVSDRPPQAFTAGGITLQLVRSPEGLLAVIVLDEASETDLFTILCADLLAVAAAAADRSHALHSLFRRLNAWRAFLRERRALSSAEIVGLVGELVVLERLLVVADRPLELWIAAQGLHDFASGPTAVEVKTTLGAGRSITVSGLDQFDAVGFDTLHLIHVRLRPSRGGRTPRAMIADLETAFSARGERVAFEDALLARGLPPHVRPDEPAALIDSLRAFEVRSGFPRLTSADVPPGVLDARYDVELRALDPFEADLEAILYRLARGDE